jgi:predicted ester cyclase
MTNLIRLAEYSQRMEAEDFDAVYDYFAENFYSHVTDRVNPDESGKDIRGREKEFWSMARRAFPDMDFQVNLVLEKDDYVVSNWTLTGTHSGSDFYDVPASNQPVNINGTAILRFEDGKVVEHWGGPHCMKGVGLS